VKLCVSTNNFCTFVGWLGSAKKNRAAICVQALQKLKELLGEEEFDKIKIQLQFEDGLTEKLNNEKEIFAQINEFLRSGTLLYSPLCHRTVGIESNTVAIDHSEAQVAAKETPPETEAELRKRRIYKLTTFDAIEPRLTQNGGYQNVYKIMVASEEDGRPALTKFTQMLASRAQNKQISSQNLSEGLIHDIFCRS
jgi:hypothetical protein